METTGPYSKLIPIYCLFAGIGDYGAALMPLANVAFLPRNGTTMHNKNHRANDDDGKDHIMAGDIVPMRPDEIAPHDLLLAGFLFQPFSIAGVSKKNALGREHGFRCKAHRGKSQHVQHTFSIKKDGTPFHFIILVCHQKNQSGSISFPSFPL